MLEKFGVKAWTRGGLVFFVVSQETWERILLTLFDWLLCC